MAQDHRTHQLILTPEGLKKLEEELNELRSVRRIEVAERIKQAISFGDLSENAEYDEAKNEQGFIEGRIRDIEKMLREARVVKEEDINTDAVGIGSRVRVRDEDDEYAEYTVVGSTEANPASLRISNESPLGHALLGAQVGETVMVPAPGGAYALSIIEICRT